MSFDRIPIAYSFNREIYDKGPPSTQIKEDTLLTFMALSDIKSKIKSGNVYDVKNRLENIINVYNQNVKYINHSIANQSEFQTCSYEQYCEGRYPKPSRNEYQHEESLRLHQVFKGMDEKGQITQLGYVFSKLAEKITGTINRFNSIESISTKLSTSALITPTNRYEHDLFAPRLRKIEAPVETPKVAMAVAIETPAAAPVETIETPTPTAPKVDVTVLHNLTPEQTLGICCDPTWDKLPTLFTKAENGWKGQVPLNQDWKFVILQDGKVTVWEKGNNRRCNEQTQAFALKANEVRF